MNIVTRLIAATAIVLVCSVDFAHAGDNRNGNNGAGQNYAIAGAAAAAGAVATGGASSAIVNNSIAGGGYGGGSYGGIPNPLITLGNTGSAPGFGVPPCGEAWSVGIGPLTGGQTTEAAACVAAREAQMMGMFPPGSAGYTRMCLGSDGWRKTDALGAKACPGATKVAPEQVQQAAVAPAPAFDATPYRSASTCLTAASLAGAAPSNCAGLQ